MAQLVLNAFQEELRVGLMKLEIMEACFNLFIRELLVVHREIAEPTLVLLKEVNLQELVAAHLLFFVLTDFTSASEDEGTRIIVEHAVVS